MFSNSRWNYVSKSRLKPFKTFFWLRRNPWISFTLGYWAHHDFCLLTAFSLVSSSVRSIMLQIKRWRGAIFRKTGFHLSFLIVFFFFSYHLFPIFYFSPFPMERSGSLAIFPLPCKFSAVSLIRASFSKKASTGKWWGGV